MRAELSVVVRGGRVVELAAAPPLGARVLPQPAGDHGHGLRLVLVGTAASLVAGDRLSIRLDIGPDDRLSVRSVAAQLALPCPPGCSTALDIDVAVGPGGRLDWWPEPLVLTAGARHRSSTSLRLAPRSAVRWVDELVVIGPGRPPEVTTTLGADFDGRPLWRDGLCTMRPGWSGPAVAGAAGYVGTAALLGDASPVGAASSVGAAAHVGAAARVGDASPVGAASPPCWPPPWSPLAGPGALARVVEADPLVGRAALAEIVAAPAAALAWMGE